MMRRLEDIRAAGEKHQREIRKVIRSSKPNFIYLKIKMYWPNGHETEGNKMEAPQYILQHALQGKGDWSLARDLLEAGKQAAQAPFPPDETELPIALTISVEATLPSKVEQLVSKDFEVWGIPTLIVAGRTEAGLQWFNLTLFDVDPKNPIRKFGGKLPADLSKELEAIKELAQDFLEPFFIGLKSGIKSENKFLIDMASFENEDKEDN